MAEQRLPVPRHRFVSREQFLEHLYPQVRRPAAGSGHPEISWRSHLLSGDSESGEKRRRTAAAHWAACCQGRRLKAPVNRLGN